MESIGLILGILISFFALLTSIGKIINKLFPMLFYENRIKVKNDYYLAIEADELAKKEIDIVKKDIVFKKRCRYYGTNDAEKHKIIPQLVYYSVVNTLEQAIVLSKYITLNDRLKKVTLDIKNNTGKTIFLLSCSVLFFLVSLYYSAQKFDDTFKAYFYMIFSIAFFLAGFLLCILLFTGVDEIWKARKTVNQQQHAMRKIYLEIIKRNKKDSR